MTNYLAFRGAITEAGLTMSKLAKMVGMSRDSMRLKANGTREFDCREVLRIQKALGISNRRRDEIFFPDDVDDMATQLSAWRDENEITG